MQHRYKNKWVLLLILLIFFFPMSAAYWLYHNAHQLIQHTSQHGLLLQPAIDLHALPLKDLQGNTPLQNPLDHHWTLLTATKDKTMTPANVKKLYAMRQIRLMLGKNMDKLQRVLIFYAVPHGLTADPIVKPYQGTLFLTLPFATAKNVSVEKTTFAETAEKNFLVVDPRGQLILLYSLDTNPKYIMQDLRKLMG